MARTDASPALTVNAFDRAAKINLRATGEVYHYLRIREALPPADDDERVVWRAGSRLERIARDAWGTPKLWWLLIDLNDLVDEWAIPVGTELRVPSRTRIERLLSTPKERLR